MGSELTQTSGPARTPAPTLVAVGLSKSFSGVPVLSDVSLTLTSGEVVGLIGQNGSGKSTLIKILSGFHAPEHGAQVSMGGTDVTAHLGAGPAQTGMAFIHQDLALIPSMTILENLRIGRFATGAGRRILWQQEREHVRADLAKVGVSASPDTLVGDLSVTERALVAIARGLADASAGASGDDGASSHSTVEGRLLVLDEPTAYLPREGVERLFAVVRSLSEAGASVLFVSHRLDEVIEHCDRVVVLRGGSLVADVPVEGKSERDLVELMLGRRPEQLYPEHRTGEAETVLDVQGIAGQYAAGLSFTARRGEILGFVGLPGGGYDEVPYLLSGASPGTAGRVCVGSETYQAAWLTPARAMRCGIAMVPADRKGASGAIGADVKGNMTLPTLGSYARSGVLRSRRERRAVDAELQRFDVRPRRSDVPLAALSGGNQQKVLLAKWFLSTPRVLALHEPTQGVDVGAKADVFTHLVRMAKEGAVVLLSSVEYEDLAHLCDRVYVVRDGVITRTLERGELSAHAVAAAVYDADVVP